MSSGSIKPLGFAPLPSEARSRYPSRQQPGDEAEDGGWALNQDANEVGPDSGFTTDDTELELLPDLGLSLDPHSLQLETTGATSHLSGAQRTLPAYIRARRVEALAQREQLGFWERQTIFKHSIAAKLREVGEDGRADRLEWCHTEKVHGVCTDCQKHKTFFRRCDKFYCPECQPKLARMRKASVEWWTKEAKQPKHIVLTARNTDRLDKYRVQHLKSALAKLRRRKFARNWRGGMWSLETTNEGQGWHLHFHLLVEAAWVDAKELAREWASLVGQDFAIVKVKDVRESNYLSEVTKYVCKGSDLAKWTPQQIADFIDSFEGTRTFGVFGSLYGKRTEFAEWLKTIREHKPACDCGCLTLRIYNENEWLARDLNPEPSYASRPPPQDDLQTVLGINVPYGSHYDAGL